jgi:hypothetical protein
MHATWVQVYDRNYRMFLSPANDNAKEERVRQEFIIINFNNLFLLRYLT